MESKKLRKRKQREQSMTTQVRKHQSKAEQDMFCLATRAHDGHGNLIWPSGSWK